MSPLTRRFSYFETTNSRSTSAHAPVCWVSTGISISRAITTLISTRLTRRRLRSCWGCRFSSPAGEARPPGPQEVLVSADVADYVGVQPGTAAIVEFVYSGAGEPIIRRFDGLRLIGTFDMAGPDEGRFGAILAFQCARSGCPHGSGGSGPCRCYLASNRCQPGAVPRIPLLSKGMNSRAEEARRPACARETSSSCGQVPLARRGSRKDRRNDARRHLPRGPAAHRSEGHSGRDPGEDLVRFNDDMVAAFNPLYPRRPVAERRIDAGLPQIGRFEQVRVARRSFGAITACGLDPAYPNMPYGGGPGRYASMPSNDAIKWLLQCRTGAPEVR